MALHDVAAAIISARRRCALTPLVDLQSKTLLVPPWMEIAASRQAREL
jgi:hypothetical protein